MIVFSTIYENSYRKGDRKMTITFVPELSGIYFFLNWRKIYAEYN